MKATDPAPIFQNPLDNSMVSLVSTTRRSRQSRKLRSTTASKQGQHEAPDSATEAVPKKEESPIIEADNENEDFSTVKKAAGSPEQNTDSQEKDKEIETKKHEDIMVH